MGILNIVTYIPAIGAVLLLFFRKDNPGAIKATATAVAVIDFIASLYIWINFDSTKLWQFRETYTWIPSLNVKYDFAIDGIALLLIILTTFMGIIAIVSSYSAIDHRQKEYYILLLLLQTGMIGTFCAMDFFLFYLFWEIMLVPMYFIIGIWGGPRKLYAAIKFFLYTLSGSVVMLLSILFLYFNHHNVTGLYTFSIPELYKTAPLIPFHYAGWLFMGFFLGFAIKVPMF